MRAFYNDFLVDGQPILMPDADVEFSFADLDSDDSGRDESGVWHRILLRSGVGSWSMNYSVLTTEEYRYMESLFAGKAEFAFTYRDINGTSVSCPAYRSDHSITLHNAKTGLYRNYKLNITQC